jgi:hypothetical protein
MGGISGPASIKNPGALIVTILYMVLSIFASTLVTAALYYPLYRWCIRQFQWSKFFGKKLLADYKTF